MISSLKAKYNSIEEAKSKVSPKELILHLFDRYGADIVKRIERFEIFLSEEADIKSKIIFTKLLISDVIEKVEKEAECKLKTFDVTPDKNNDLDITISFIKNGQEIFATDE